MAVGGVLCVGLAALGAVVPGLPTTVFLIAASYLFVRSCPAFERVLIRNRFFAPFVVYLDNPTAMPWRAKVIAATLMWISVTVSVVFLLMSERTAAWIATLPVAAAGVGTYFIFRTRGDQRRPADN